LVDTLELGWLLLHGSGDLARQRNWRMFDFDGGLPELGVQSVVRRAVLVQWSFSVPTLLSSAGLQPSHVIAFKLALLG